jgi:hypothetical protein
MRKCGYCGHENSEEATLCEACGTGFLVPTKVLRWFRSQERRPPLCGVLSAIMPLMAFALAYLTFEFLIKFPPAGGGDGRLRYLAYPIFAFLGSLVTGMVLATVGIVRRERLKALPWIAFLLNAAILVSAILDNRQ